MMPEKTTLWHNPRCSKSRQALALLQDRNVQVSLRLYLKDIPTKAEITALRDALGVTADAMMRKGEKLFKELGLAQVSEAELIAAMAAHPILIERPVLVHDGQAVIGRPPETVLSIL